MIQDPTEFKCDRCNGEGKLYVRRNIQGELQNMMCRKCMGKGYLDWIENAMGRAKPRTISTAGGVGISYPSATTITITRDNATFKNCQFLGGQVGKHNIKYSSGKKISFGTNTRGFLRTIGSYVCNGINKLTRRC